MIETLPVPTAPEGLVNRRGCLRQSGTRRSSFSLSLEMVVMRPGVVGAHSGVPDWNGEELETSLLHPPPPSAPHAQDVAHPQDDRLLI